MNYGLQGQKGSKSRRTISNQTQREMSVDNLQMKSSALHRNLQNDSPLTQLKNDMKKLNNRGVVTQMTPRTRSKDTRNNDDILVSIF